MDSTDIPDEPFDISADEQSMMIVRHPRITQLQANAGFRIRRRTPEEMEAIAKQQIQEENETSNLINISNEENVVAPFELLPHDLDAISVIKSPAPTNRREIETLSLDEVIRSRPTIIVGGGMKRKLSSSDFGNMSLSQIIAEQENGGENSVNKSLDKIIQRRNGNNNQEGGGEKKKSPSSSLHNDGDAEMTEQNGPTLSFAVPWPKKARRSNDTGSETTKVPKYTPQSCIRLLAEAGYFFEYEVYEMTEIEHPLFHKRRWRVTVSEWRENDGKFVGIGEAPRKALARESAILDLLEKMQENRPECLIPMCEIPKGARISPFVLQALERLCEQKGLSRPSYRENLVTIKGREKFQFKVFVDDQEFSEVAFDLKFAKLGAAKKAYDSLSDHEFRYDDIVKGDQCLEEGKYEMVGAEELHIVVAKNRPLVKPMIWDSCRSSRGPSAAASPVLFENDDDALDGRDTPSSATSFRSIRIATVSAPEMPPILAKIRSRIQAANAEQKAMREILGAGATGLPVMLGMETGVSGNPFFTKSPNLV